MAKWSLGILLALAAVLSVPAPAAAGGAPRSITGRLTVDALGDARLEAEVRFPPTDAASARATTPDPARYFPRLCPSRPDYQVGPDVQVAWVAGQPALTAQGSLLGLARYRGNGRWELHLGRTFSQGSPLPDDPALRAWRFAVNGTLDAGRPVRGSLEVRLPAGATGPRWAEADRKLHWTLAPAPAAGPATLVGGLEATARVVSGAYKVYTLARDFVARRVPLPNGGEVVVGSDISTPWVARLVLRNEGPGIARDLRVRFLLEGYVADWSGAERWPEVLPGQTVVAVYYPVIQPTIARLRDDTRANVAAAWTWTEGQGAETRERKDDAWTRSTLLGANNFAFSDLGAAESFGTFAEGLNNGPLLAAWVSRNDGVINQFAGMANKNAGGVAASTKDEFALKAMRACYELMIFNEITYQSPPDTLRDRGQSFDVSRVQTVKFPRDVIKNRSGTCIDLAILYASMLNAVGLKPILVLIDGHCFPAASLPESGRIVGLESTGVGGGLRGGFMPWAKALEVGTAEFERALESGRYLLVPVHEMWEAEILTPELEELPADILQRWSVTGKAPEGWEEALRDPIVGTWTGELTQELDGGGTVTYPIALTVAPDPDAPEASGALLATSRAAVSVPSAGGPVRMEVVAHYLGARRGEGYVLRGVEKRITVVSTGKALEPAPPPDTLVGRVVEGRLVGRLGSDAEGWLEFSFGRAP